MKAADLAMYISYFNSLEDRYTAILGLYEEAIFSLVPKLMVKGIKFK